MAERPIAPVLKTGVPARVPRVRIPVSPLPIVARKRSVYLRNPENPRGFFAFKDLGIARVRRPVPGLQECKKGKTVTIRGKLNGTNTGTSAPLTAPFFGRFWGSTDWKNRCMAGSSSGGWLTFALENYLWSRRRLRATALAVAQRATPRSGGSAISGFSCCSPLNAEFRCSCETRGIQPRTL